MVPPLPAHHAEHFSIKRVSIRHLFKERTSLMTCLDQQKLEEVSASFQPSLKGICCFLSLSSQLPCWVISLAVGNSLMQLIWQTTEGALRRQMRGCRWGQAAWVTGGAEEPLSQGFPSFSPTHRIMGNKLLFLKPLNLAWLVIKP